MPGKHLATPYIQFWSEGGTDRQKLCFISINTCMQLSAKLHYLEIAADPGAEI